jgi:Fe-S-cluster containining protein
MVMINSVDKIVMTYFACITDQGFNYQSRKFEPKPLLVSPFLFRSFSCPENCGGCCPKFSLDYLHPVKSLPDVNLRTVEFNGKLIEVYSDNQEETEGHFCKFLDLTNGRCKIYERRPFSCDFELVRFVMKDERNILTQKKFARGWAMTRVDGNKGALCDLNPPSINQVKEVIRKLIMLEQWAKHFGISTKIEKILDWIATGNLTKYQEF